MRGGSCGFKLTQTSMSNGKEFLDWNILSNITPTHNFEPWGCIPLDLIQFNNQSESNSIQMLNSSQFNFDTNNYFPIH